MASKSDPMKDNPPSNENMPKPKRPCYCCSSRRSWGKATEEAVPKKDKTPQASNIVRPCDTEEPASVNTNARRHEEASAPSDKKQVPTRTANDESHQASNNVGPCEEEKPSVSNNGDNPNEPSSQGGIPIPNKKYGHPRDIHSPNFGNFFNFISFWRMMTSQLFTSAYIRPSCEVVQPIPSRAGDDAGSFPRLKNFVRWILWLFEF